MDMPQLSVRHAVRAELRRSRVHAVRPLHRFTSRSSRCCFMRPPAAQHSGRPARPLLGGLEPHQRRAIVLGLFRGFSPGGPPALPPGACSACAHLRSLLVPRLWCGLLRWCCCETLRPNTTLGCLALEPRLVQSRATQL